MAESSRPIRDLRTLRIDASDAQYGLERRAEELEELAVKLAALLAAGGSKFPGVSDRELELLQVAQRGSDERRRWTESRRSALRVDDRPMRVLPD